MELEKSVRVRNLITKNLGTVQRRPRKNSSLVTVLWDGFSAPVKTEQGELEIVTGAEPAPAKPVNCGGYLKSLKEFQKEARELSADIDRVVARAERMVL